MPNQLITNPDPKASDYPRYTIYLYGVGTLTGADFYDPCITDKINQIPEATLMFHNRVPEDLEEQAIRIYLGAKKVFSGKIKKAEQSYNSNETSVICKGLVEYLHEKVIETPIDLTGEVSSDIIDDHLKLVGWTYDYTGKDDENIDYQLDYRIEKGNFLMHINAICILNYWEWWGEGRDTADPTIETRVLRIAAYRGDPTPSITFVLDTNSFNAAISIDKDTVKNVIVVSGASSAASNLSTTAAGFFKAADATTPAEMGRLLGSESVLAEAVAIGDTTLTLVDSSGYESAGTVLIDNETFTYSANSGTVLTLSSAASAAHEPQAPVLITSLFRAYVPASMQGNTTFWLGNELVTVTSVDYWGLHGLTRGQIYNNESTAIYAHKAGTRIYSGTYSLLNPSVGSSIIDNTRKDARITSIGTVDWDGLDKYGSSYLQATQNLVPYGSFNVALDELQDIDVGDWFYLQEQGTTSVVLRRCTGIVYGDEVSEIIFGSNDEAVAQQFDDISKVDDATYARQDQGSSQEVLETSGDGTAIKVQLANGDIKWVPMR